MEDYCTPMERQVILGTPLSITFFHAAIHSRTFFSKPCAVGS